MQLFPEFSPVKHQDQKQAEELFGCRRWVPDVSIGSQLRCWYSRCVSEFAYPWWNYSQACKARCSCDFSCSSAHYQVLCQTEYSHAWGSALYNLFAFVYYIDCFFPEGFSCFMFWIKLCVPLWSNTLTCRYGTRLMKNPLTSLWQLNSSWTCTYYLFRWLLGCA